MKKLLSICLLSVLLTMMSFFTAQAQSSNPSCCFWVENMQPVTAQHIANLDGTGIAQDTSAGMPLVLNNVLNRAVVGNTDVYTLHFPTGADCGSKVSIEWLVYRDGQLLNGNLSDYADLGIYTRFDQINNGVCERINWLGGIVDNGDGVCGCNPSTWNVDHNDFPGARQANPLTPAYFDETHHAAGYQHVMYTYNFDYFYLPFLASNHSTTNVIIKWKQVGNYSLVIRIRERLGGTDYDFTMDGSQNPSQYIGGHQSCCGQILYQDSLHYLVTTAHEKSICDGETFMYGRGQETASGSTLYAFTEESLYYVLFGDYVCDHWKVERIDTLQLYTRINPDIVARDTNLCRDENFTAADLLGLVTEVDLDAPGIIGHEIRWSENGVSWVTDMSQLLSLNQLTQTAGQYSFYARQFNFYYDAMDDDTIGCGGQVDTVVVNVRDLFPPILEGDHYYSYCNETLEANSPVVLRAHLDPQDFCSTEIRWYTEDDLGYPTHAAAYLKQVGDTISLDLTEMNPVNEDKVITYYLYAINTNTNTFSAKYDSVTFEFFMTPEFVVDSTQLDFVVCPGASVTMNSMVTSIEPDYNDVLPTVTYEWFKNNVSLSNDTNFTVNASMVCNQVDTYMVHITAATIKGCSNEMTRTYTVKAQDIENPVIAWNTTVGTFDTVGNKIRTLSGCDSSAVPAPYTLADFAIQAQSTSVATEIGTITDGCLNVNTLNVTDVVTSHTACQTIVTRTYEAVDACGNHSNIISEIFTINNDFKPVITGGRIDVNPVRDTACTYDVPSYATLFNIFNTDTNIKVTYNCTESTFDTVVFYINNTDVVADGNLNIFPGTTDLVTIYAVVTDACGNQSDKTPVFDIHKPAAMRIVPGAITLDTLELCVDATTNMHFNDGFVLNADRPYTHEWSQINYVGQSVITPDPNNDVEAVVSPAIMNINTSSIFIMTVTDSLGCVASTKSNAIHFYRLPDVTISSHPNNEGNPIVSGDTLCPNYGMFYVVAGGHNNLPDSNGLISTPLAYTWTNATYNTNKQAYGFEISCRNCDTLYQPIVTATNAKNCTSTDTFNIYAKDRFAPVVTAITDTVLPLASGCSIYVPNFTRNNTVFDNSTVSDDCFKLEDMTFEQDTFDFYINHDTIVTVTITTPCGQAKVHQIHVRMPDNTIHITGIPADTVGCEPLTVTLTPNIVNANGNITYKWTYGTHTATTETISETLYDTAHTFTLMVTDAAGCAHDTTVYPTVYRKPVREDFLFATTPNTYCDPAQADGTFTITVLNDSTAHIDGFLKDGDVYNPYRPLNYTYEGLFDGPCIYTVYTTDGCSTTFNQDSIEKNTDDPNAPFRAFVIDHNYNCISPYSGSVAVVPDKEDYVYQISGDAHVTDADVITHHNVVNTDTVMFNWLYQDTYRVFVVTAKGCHYETNEVEVLNYTDTPARHTIDYDTADCHLNNGVVYVVNPKPQYFYQLNNGVAKQGNAPVSFSGLAAGEYDLRIFNSGQCYTIQRVIVPSHYTPARPVLSIDTNRSCTPDFSTGAFTIAAANVNDGFTYKLYNYETSTSYLYGTTVTSTLVDSVVGVAGTALVFDSLTDGAYQWIVTDDHNCSLTFLDTIPQADLHVDTNKINLVHGDRCDTANNVLTIVNPDNNYDYVLYQKFGTSYYLIDTFPANGVLLVQEYGTNYVVRKIHKQLKCAAENEPFNMLDPVPAYNFTVAHTPDRDCSALGTGTITVNSPSANYSYYLYEGKAYNSYSYYAYMDANQGTDYLSDNATSFTGLDGNGINNYQIYTIFAVNNTTACANSLYDTIRLDSYTPIISNVTATPNYMCKVDKNGTITATLDSVVNGTFYLRDASNHDVASNATGFFTGLDDGTYRVYFKSEYHCTSNAENSVVIDSAFIEPVFVITPDHTCQPSWNQEGSGCITVVHPQGVPGVDYGYFIDVPGMPRYTIDVPGYTWCYLDEGSYLVRIADSLTGCSIDTNVTVPFVPSHVTLDIVAVDNINCEGTPNGSIKVTATSDLLDAQLVFSLDSADWRDNGSTITNLAPGTYKIFVRDTFYNCVYDTCFNRDVTINTVEQILTIDSTLTNNTACNPNLYNGSIIINSVKYADGTDVNTTLTITHFDGSAVDYAVATSNGWNHLNGVTYKVNIKDNTTGCDTSLIADLTTENVCSPTLSFIPVNNNTHVAPEPKHYYFCQGAENTYLIAEATSSCPSEFTYTWQSNCTYPSAYSNDTLYINSANTYCCKYYVTAYALATGCYSTDTIHVCVDPKPMITFVSSLSLDPTKLNAPNPYYLNCENNAYDFGIVNPTPQFDSIIWSNARVDTNHATFSEPADKWTPGQITYCIKVQDQNGCSNYDAANVITMPIFRTTVPVDSCGSFTYDAQSGIHYHYTTVGTYTVVDTFAAVNGCDSIVTLNVTIYPLPTVNTTQLPIAALYCDGDTLSHKIPGFTLTTTNDATNGYRLSAYNDPSQFDIDHDIEFNIDEPMSRSMNNKYLYSFAANGCDTVYMVAGRLKVDSLPVVTGVVSTDPRFCAGSECPGTVLDASVVAWNATSGTQTTNNWLVSATTDFTGASVITNAEAANDQQYVNFAATNHCGTTYATPVQITVIVVTPPTVTLASNAFCAGDVINASDITITHTSSTATPVDTTYKLGDNTFTPGVTKLTVDDSGLKVSVMIKYDCGTPISSDSVAIVVNDTARMVVFGGVDTICVHGGTPVTYTIDTLPTNIVTITPTNATFVQTGNQVVVTPTAVGAGSIEFKSEGVGGCDVKTVTKTFVVADTADNFGTIANVEVCAGATLSLTPPSYDDHATHIYSEGWLLDGSTLLTTYRAAVADSGKTLTYFVENICGTAHSMNAVLQVNDTAHLVTSTTHAVTDTLCIGNQFTVDYTIHASNTLEVTATPSDLVKITKTGTETGTITVEALKFGNGSITIVSKPAKTDCAPNKEITIEFRNADTVTLNKIGDDPDAVCEGEQLALTAPTVAEMANSNVIKSQKWQVKTGTAFVDFDPATQMEMSYNDAKLRYVVENICGESYSDTVTITVHDKATLSAPDNIRNQIICNGASINNIALISNRTSFQLDQNLIDAGLSINTDGVISATAVNAPTSATFPYTLKGAVKTVSTYCTTYDKVDTVIITINAAPTATLAVDPDTLCAGTTISATPTVVNNSTVTATGKYMMKTKLAPADEFVLTTPVTVAMDSALLYYQVSNSCGTNYSDTTIIRVRGTVSVNIDLVTFRDTCSGNKLSDFIESGTPVVTPETPVTPVDSAFWFKKVGPNYVKLTMDSIITNPTTLVYGAYTMCAIDPVYSTEKVLNFDAAPAFVSTPFNASNFKVCEGDLFTEPTLVLGTHITPLTPEVTKTWTLDGSAMDFAVAYDHATYDGKEIKLVISNACGADFAMTNVTIDTLPVPHMLADTTICATGTEQFRLEVANVHTGSYYEWKNSDGTHFDNGSSLPITAAAIDTIMRFYVVETDANGCVSTTRINVTPEAINDSMITVRVTGYPYFVFTNMAGDTTHHIKSSTNNATTAFNWTLSDECYKQYGTKLYVNFSIYHDGVLIPNDQLSNYISTSHSTLNNHTYSWNTKQTVYFTSADGQATLSDSAFYTSTNNHYPNRSLGFAGSPHELDWMYFRFMYSRFFMNTLSSFEQTGDYEIHYELYTTDGSEFGLYFNDGSASRIGGHNSTGGTLIASDVFHIHVDNGPAYANSEAPEAPQNDIISEEPTVKVYPNPTSENVNVRIEGISGQTTIRISTLTGKTVAQRAINIDNDFSVETFNVSDLTPGVYVLQIVNSDAMISRKLVITK